MKNTRELFGMTAGELQEIRNECGYTREECKLLDASENTRFFETLESLEESKKYYSERFAICEAVRMVGGRFALLLSH